MAFASDHLSLWTLRRMMSWKAPLSGTGRASRGFYFPLRPGCREAWRRTQDPARGCSACFPGRTCVSPANLPRPGPSDVDPTVCLQSRAEEPRPPTRLMCKWASGPGPGEQVRERRGRAGGGQSGAARGRADRGAPCRGWKLEGGEGWPWAGEEAPGSSRGREPRAKVVLLITDSLGGQGGSLPMAELRFSFKPGPPAPRFRQLPLRAPAPPLQPSAGRARCWPWGQWGLVGTLFRCPGLRKRGTGKKVSPSLSPPIIAGSSCVEGARTAGLSPL